MSVKTKCGICKNDEQTLGRIIFPHAVCNECMKWGAHTIAQRDALLAACEVVDNYLHNCNCPHTNDEVIDAVHGALALCKDYDVMHEWSGKKFADIVTPKEGKP